jgi:hypothetical protein
VFPRGLFGDTPLPQIVEPLLEVAAAASRRPARARRRPRRVAQRQPSAGATRVRMLSMTCAL